MNSLKRLNTAIFYNRGRQYQKNVFRSNFKEFRVYVIIQLFIFFFIIYLIYNLVTKIHQQISMIGN